MLNRGGPKGPPYNRREGPPDNRREGPPGNRREGPPGNRREGRPYNRAALVVFVRGLNVGGHRRFRPAVLAQELQHLDVVNVGAAGTFVIRRSVGRKELHAEMARHLPFDAEIMICTGADIVSLTSQDFFSRYTVRADMVRFVSVLSRPPRSEPRLPLILPSDGRWLLKVLARQGRFVLGLYRRHMKVIGYLGALDRMFGVPATTRNWNTMTAVAKLL